MKKLTSMAFLLLFLIIESCSPQTNQSEEWYSLVDQLSFGNIITYKNVKENFGEPSSLLVPVDQTEVDFIAAYSLRELPGSNNCVYVDVKNNLVLSISFGIADQ